MKLFDLLQAVDVVESWNKKNIDISGIAYHSKKVAPGDIFVCIKGYKTDGHRYVMGAIANGASAIIVEDYQEGWDIPQIRVEDSRKALAALSDEFYNNPSKDMKIIGITATNGKTTTSFMTNAILEGHGLKTGLIGTVKVKIGDSYEPSKLTTPESLDLHHYFAKMRDQGITHVTMEASSSALYLKRVGNVDFDIVTLNNISREHIDLHGSFEEYFESKSSLIKNAGPDKWAILNLDCPYSSSLIDSTQAQVLTFGVERRDGHLACKNLDLSTGRAKFTVEIGRSFKVGNIRYEPRSFDIELSVPGYHSVYNSMVAISIGLLCGIPISTIQESIKSFNGVERRFEFIFEEDFKIIDDHFANSGNIDVTLGTLDFMDYNNLNLVYAIRGGRGPTVNRENAETIVKWASKLGISEIVATLSKSHVTDKDIVTEEELEVFLEVISDAGIKVQLYEELPQAISHALKNVGDNDVVLLSGCQGMDYGAQIALEQLHKLRPEIDKKRLFAPLENRVAGII
ncbi:UDP-N-acetylmuramoyl-L-alanyl-D-glutamate--2,6-diaminopimelate ligase [Sporosalibacterium faouarense]|uniref:Mur ligase family protein n=1 Tax=Sporosalibacterium faouarense TaxID=516123 RepID=UPI00311CA5F4